MLESVVKNGTTVSILLTKTVSGGNMNESEVIHIKKQCTACELRWSFTKILVR